MKSVRDIRTSKNQSKTEESLFPDPQLLVAALTSNQVGLWEWDMSSTKVVWSDNVASLFGLDSESFEGTFEYYLKLIHPDDLAHLQRCIQESMASGKSYSVQHRIIHPDGSIKWLEGEGTTHFAADGHPTKMTGIVRDISVRKKSELLVQEREKLFALLAEATQALFLDPNWHSALSKAFSKIGSNTEVDRMYLFKVDEVSEKTEPTISQLIEWNSGTSEPPLKNPVLQNMVLIDFEPFFVPLLKGEPLNEIVAKISDTKLRETLQEQDIQSILIFPIQSHSKFWGFLGFDQCTHARIWSEIELAVLQSFSATLAGSIEKHEAEKEKSDWKTKHEIIVNASGQIIYDYNIINGQIHWSGGVTSKLGYSLTEMGNIDKWIELIHPDDRVQSIANLEEAEKSLSQYDVYYRFKHKHGHYVNLHDRGTFLADKNGRAYRMLGMMIDVTESVKSKIEKEEIEIAYKTLFDNTPDAIIIATTDDSNQIVSANKAAAEMHGYGLEEFSSLSVKDIKGPGDGWDLKKRMEGLLKGVRKSHGANHKKKDGTIFPVMIYSGIIDVRGQNYLMSIYQDITEVKNSQYKLEESLSLLTATIESTADGILAVDNAGKVSTFNKKFLKLWSIPSSLVEMRDDEKLLQHVLSQLANPDAFLTKVRYLYDNPTEKSDDLIHFLDGRVYHRYSKPVKINESVVGRVWSFRDITTQVRYEESLQESELRFKKLQEASFGGICMHDMGVIIDVNQGLSNLTGYDREELIGMNGIENLLAPEFYSTVAANTKAGCEQAYDVVGRKKDGSSVFLEVQGKTIPYKGRQVRVTEFRDITNRKLAEQKILEDKSRFSSIAENLTRKNEQLEEFTQIVSHNLRSPVGNISSLLQLHSIAANEEERSEILELLLQTSKSLLTTMQELNEVLKIKQSEKVEKQLLVFSEVHERVINMFHTKIIEVGAKVTSDFDEAPTINYANIYIESIFLNLLSNGLKYIRQGTIPQIHFKTKVIDGATILTVSDNGLGINLEKYGHQIFKMRKTFHVHPDSRGIGLFMVKNQVESMGGEISVESKENEGTTFTLNFNKNL